MPFRFLAAFCLAIVQFSLSANAQTLSSDCLAVAQGPARVQFAGLVPAALTENQVQLTSIGHSTFLIESSGGLRIATDFSGNAGGIVPDVITMNRAHRSHYTTTPDPAIKHVLRGWNEDGTPARHDVTFGDVHIRNVTTDIRGGMLGRVPDGNSIFIFEVAGSASATSATCTTNSRPPISARSAGSMWCWCLSTAATPCRSST